MTIRLERVSVPAGSTIGYGLGVDERGCRVRFASDWRPLRDLGEALAGAVEPILVGIETWQIINVEEASR